jgi:uncharacterized lipoprotein YajG
MSKNKFTRIIAVVGILLCCSFVSAFGGRPPANEVSESEVLETIIGHVNVYGAEPHTYLGIVTGDDKSYTILAEKNVLSELQCAQGKQIAFRGVIIPREDENGTKMLYQTLKNGKFKLTSWTVVSK